jgi:hypothetical protein
MFCAIGYDRTYPNLERTLHNFYLHSNRGGVVVIEPWFTRAAFHEGAPGMTTYSDHQTKVARLDVSKVRKNVSILEMHYLIAERNETVKHYIERHEIGLFGHKETLNLMKTAGFKAKFLRGKLNKAKGFGDRGVFVGVKT